MIVYICLIGLVLLVASFGFKKSIRKTTSVPDYNIIDAAPIALVGIDDRGAIRLCNQEATRLFGYTKKELLGAKVELLLPQRYHSAHLKLRNSYQKNPQQRLMGSGRDLYARKKDNTEFPVEIGLNPIQQGDQKLVVASIMDLSLRKQHEQELGTVNSQLRALSMELDQFAHTVAHDLKEPLRGIRTYSEMILEDYGSTWPDQALRDLKSISNLAGKGTNLIGHLLKLARLGQSELNLCIVNLDDLVNEVVQSLHHLLKEKQIEVTVEPCLPAIVVDEVLFHELLHNLISNAAKYQSKDNTHKEISIGIATSGFPYEHPDLLNMSYADKESAILYIRDSGIGMTSEEIVRSLQVFKRIASHCEEPGDGVGLAFVQKIVQRLNGQIWIESEPGVGTTVYVHLTLAQTATV